MVGTGSMVRYCMGQWLGIGSMVGTGSMGFKAHDTSEIGIHNVLVFGLWSGIGTVIVVL